MKSPLLLSENHRDIRKIAALAGHQIQTPKSLQNLKTKRKLANSYVHTKTIQKQTLPSIFQNVKQKDFKFGGEPGLPLGGLLLESTREAPATRKRPPLEHHPNSPDPSYLQEVLKRRNSELHKSYASKVRPSDIDQFLYEKPMQQQIHVTQSLDLPSKLKLPNIDKGKQHQAETTNMKVSLKMTNVDHELTSQDILPSKDEVNGATSSQELVFAHGGNTHCAASTASEKGSDSGNTSDKGHQRREHSHLSYQVSDESIDLRQVQTSSEHDSENKPSVQPKGKEAMEYHLKYKHGIIPRIKKRSQPLNAVSPGQLDLHMLDQMKAYDYLRTDRSLSLSFIDELHKEPNPSSGWAPNVCKECEIKDNHEKWCSQYQSQDGENEDFSDAQNDFSLIDDELDLPPIYREASDRLEKLKQWQKVMADKVAIAEFERQPSNIFKFTRAGVNEEANEKPLFPNGPRDAYLKALRVSRTHNFPREPWMLGGQTSRAFVFSYFEDLHLPGLRSEARPPRLKIKNEMKHLLNNQDVNDYYPGGSKNPLDPIMYGAFLKMVNSKAEGVKRKKKLNKNNGMSTLKVEHSHTETSFQLK